MHHIALKDEVEREGSRFTLPPLSRDLLTSRPQLQNRLLMLDEKRVRSMGPDISWLPSATRSTMRHLSSHHSEVSQVQARVFESIGLVDREITALERVKGMAESCLQEKQLYSQLMSNCVTLSNSLSPANLRQDQVLGELKREERLTNDVKELLQQQINIMQDKLNSLKNLRNQLPAVLKDMGEAIKLMTKCMNLHSSTLSSSFPATQRELRHMNYDNWLSHCRNLRLAADKLIEDSSAFRGNLRFTLANLKNTQDRQHLSTEYALRKRINKLTRLKETLMWERQRTREEICDQTADMQKLVREIRTFETRMQQANHLLDVLNQSPIYKLCMDRPHISLLLEKQDLSEMAPKVYPVLRRSQQDLELSHQHLKALEDKLTKTAQALQLEKECQNLHRSFLTIPEATVLFTNRPGPAAPTLSPAV